MARKYTSTAIATTLSSSLGDGISDVTMYVPNAAAATFPQAYPYTLVVDADTASEEIVTVSSAMDGTLTVVRGEDGTERQTHDAGATVRHMMTPRDLREPQDHIDATNAHGVSGVVVGTSGEQTLTQKIMSGASNTFTAIPQSAVTNLVSNLADKASTTSVTAVSDALTAHSIDTTAVHGIADTSLLATTSYADGVGSAATATASAALSAHSSDTTAIHGITDTSKLATIISASAGRNISVQATAPSSPVVGDIWFQVTGL
jgi:hypothetical protein